MRRRALHTAALFGLLLGSCGAEVADAPRGEVAVASFGGDAAGASGSDLGAQLAARLSELGVGAVVPPSAVGGVGAASTTAERIALHDRTGARTLVVGTVTREGEGLALGATVLDLDSGVALGDALVEQAAGDGDLPRALGALAEHVAGRILAPPPPAAASVDANPKKRRSDGILPREPIEIQADTLDAQTVTGGRRLTFTGHVQAVQGDVTVRCDTLQAFYPTGASEPDQLTAEGNIHVTQRDRTATCSEAVFYRTEDKLVCVGSPAELIEECSRAEAERFTFYLDSERVEMVRPKVFGRECDPPSGTP